MGGSSWTQFSILLSELCMFGAGVELLRRTAEAECELLLCFPPYTPHRMLPPFQISVWKDISLLVFPKWQVVDLSVVSKSFCLVPGIRGRRKREREEWKLRRVQRRWSEVVRDLRMATPTVSFKGHTTRVVSSSSISCFLVPLYKLFCL